MKMQGNTTEIDERNLLRLDALLSHGYGLSPQLVMRSKGLSIEAKALYGYLSSFAGAGDTAFPSTSRILEELDISKNRFYKIRKELVSWGFISIETTATSAGLRTVYTLPQNPIAIKTEIDEIANRRNEIKSSLVANLHNEDMVSHKGDSEFERLQQSAGNEPCRQSEAKAQNRGSNLKPCLQSEDEGCLQSGDKLYIDTNINPKVSIDELLRLDEVALAGYFDLEDTRFEEWYEKNRAVGDRLYSAILDRKIDLVAFRGTEDGRYYSILTRSPKQEGSLQLTDIDSKGPIGHRRLTNQKMLDLPGYGAVLAAVPDISKCNERDILQAIGFTQKGDRSLKEKAAIGREGSKQLEAARNREGLENFDGRDFR